jgi:hypothetical protein
MALSVGVAVLCSMETVTETAGAGSDNPTATISHSTGEFSIVKKAERADKTAARAPCNVLGCGPAPGRIGRSDAGDPDAGPEDTLRSGNGEARNQGRENERACDPHGARAQKMLEMREKNS